MPQLRRLLPAALLILLSVGVLAASATPAAAGPRSRAAALASKLKSQRLENVKFEDAGLEDVLKWLRIATGANFVLKRSALAKAGIEPADVRATLTLEKVTPATLLGLILQPHDLAAQVKEAILQTHHLVGVGFVLDLERHGGAAVEQGQLRGNDLHLARSEVFVYTAAAGSHLTAHRNDILLSQGLGHLQTGLVDFGRIKDQLRTDLRPILTRHRPDRRLIASIDPGECGFGDCRS